MSARGTSQGGEAPAGLAVVARELYAEAPTRFVAARDARVRTLKAAGQSDLAAHVRTLRRPGPAAGLTNLLVRHDTALLTEVHELGIRLRAAQVHADAASLRALDQERRALVGRCVDTATALADEAGITATPTTVRELEQIFWAALVDVAGFAAVRDGVLVSPIAPNGFGPVDVAGASAVPATVEPDPPVPPAPPRSRPPGPTSHQPAPQEPAPAPVDHEREAALGRARADLAAAEEAAGPVRDAADDAAREAEASHAQVAQLKAELATVRERLVSLEADLRETTTADRRQAEDARSADRARRAAEAAVDRARARLHDLGGG